MHRTHPPLRAARNVIDELARQTGRSYEEARDAYERELARLESEAKIQTYVPVIARKRARETLMRH